MADLDNIVNVDITVTSAAPTRENFGTPAILAYHTHNTDVIRTYFDLAGMVSDGFTTSEPAYLMASAIVEQQPHTPSFKVIRGTTAVTQTFTFTANTETGTNMGLAVTSPLGTLTDCHITSTGNATTDATSIAALLNALPDSSASSAGAVVTFTAGTAGTLWYPEAVTGGVFRENTPTASVATDLNSANNTDPNFYGISGMYLDRTNIDAVADWAEAASPPKLHGYVTADTENLTTTTLNVDHPVMALLKSEGYKRSYGQYSGTPAGYGALGLMSQRFTADPGSDTWAYKTVVGDQPDDTLTPTQKQNVTGNNGNYYVTIAGIPVTIDGRSAQGQFMDLQRGVDALANDMQVNVFDLLVSNPKVPYTSKGIATIGGAIRASLNKFVAQGFISNDPGFEFQIFLPSIATIPSADKKARVLNNVRFSAYAQGAIQKILIQGQISF